MILRLHRKRLLVKIKAFNSYNMAAFAKLTGTTQSTTAYTSLWTMVSGPGTVTFANAAALVTGASFSAAGTYVLRLTITTASFTSTDDITVTCTANAAPVVNAGADFSVMQNTATAIAGSFTNDGLPALQFFYDFSTTILGTPATGTFRLSSAVVTSSTQMNIAVTDRYGFNRQADLLSIDSGSVIRLVNPDNTAQFIQFTCGTPTLSGGFVFWSMSSVTASSSAPFIDGTDVDFTPVFTPTTVWSMTSGTGTATFGNAAALTTTVSFSATGAKVLTLTVDDGTNVGTDTVAVDVNSTLGTDFVRATSQAVPGGASLTADGTPFLIDMSRFPVGWWNACGSSSASIRVVKAATTTEVPFHIIRFDGAADTGLMAVQSQALAGGTGFDIYCGNAANTAYAATATYGQYNVYRTAIKGFWPAGGGTDATRNANNMVTFGSPTIGAGPIGAQSYLYSTTARSALLLSAVVNSPISFFAASDTLAAADFSNWFHTIGISRTKAGTLDSFNNAVYMSAAGINPHCTMTSLNGSGSWQGSSAQCTAETWKGHGGIHLNNTSRTAVTSFATGTTSTVNNTVIELDHLAIGHFPKLLGGAGTVANPKVSLCFFFTEAVAAAELKYLDLMLTQATFWGVWVLNP